MNSNRTASSHEGDLAVVLTSATADTQDAESRLHEVHGASQRASRTLEDLETQLAEETGERPTPRELTPTSPQRPPAGVARSAIANWDAICAQAQRNLLSRGVDPSRVSLDLLLDREEVERINRRFVGPFTLRAHLDRYDVLAVVAAGLTAALVDFFIVKIPRDVVYLREFEQSGSPFTEWLRKLEVPSDNWLAKRFPVSFDRSGGRDHRLWTPGHDPFLGLVVGTIDVMRGGMTSIGSGGTLAFSSGIADPVENPLVALTRVVLHMLSDIPTHMGLPPPGWALAASLNVGSFGPKGRTVSDLARFMYSNGYDSRHFLTMGTTIAAVEVLLRAYFWIRRDLDDEYDEEATHQAQLVGATRTSEHPTFRLMALGAHGIAVAANAGKIVVYHGNPLALNYAQWLYFLRVLFAWYQQHRMNPTDLVTGRARANSMAIGEGWTASDAEEQDFPRGDSSPQR